MRSLYRPALNDKTYFTGKPCKRGHIANRRHANRSCLKCECLSAQQQRKKHRGTLQWWAAKRVCNFRATAKKDGFPFALTTADIMACIPSDRCCPALGLKLDFTHATRANNSPSVDRIVPSLGYVPGNIQVISWRANNLKSDCTDPDELQKVADFMRKTNAPNALHQRASESRLNAFSCYPASELSLPC